MSGNYKKIRMLKISPIFLYVLPPYLISFCVIRACSRPSWQPCCPKFLAMMIKRLLPDLLRCGDVAMNFVDLYACSAHRTKIYLLFSNS